MDPTLLAIWVIRLLFLGFLYLFLWSVARALLRARRSPYVCKVERADADVIECEVISACGYLTADGINCVLHDRRRPDGRPAKPRVCSRWPDLGPDDVGHPGCVLLPENVKGEA